jgi:hypothetical protein
MFGIDDIAGGILGIVKQWITGRAQTQIAKQDILLAEMQNKARLLLDQQSNNHAWEMAVLTDKDKWLRRLSFTMFAAPFFVAIIAPAHVADYFQTAIHNVPEWWQKTFMAITGGIWGLSSLKNVLPGILEAFKK